MTTALYLSAHSVLEYSEVRMLHDIGLDVFPLGSYTHPSQPGDPKRPALPQVPEHPELIKLVADLPNLGRDNLPGELIEWANVIMVCGLPLEWCVKQWDRIKHRRVIWRTIGQSNPTLERYMRALHQQGLQIVRYSPAEKRSFEAKGCFAGQDALIRFGLDPQEWYGWCGDSITVGNVTQHTPEPHGRDAFTNWDWIKQATEGLPFEFAGSHSEKVGGLGELSYDAMRQKLRDWRCYIYTGTQPASMTISLMEAMLTGCPVVSIGPYHMWDPALWEGHEIATLATNDSMQARIWLRTMLYDHDFARSESAKARIKAIQLFDIGKIAKQWETFLK